MVYGIGLAVYYPQLTNHVALFQWPETWELPGPRPKTGSPGPATAPAVPSSDPSLAIGCSGTTCENVDPFGDPKMWPNKDDPIFRV